MAEPRRTVFIVSDGTGITAEMLGRSLLTQFEGIGFHQVTVPFIDTEEKAHACVARIQEAGQSTKLRPIVFSTLVNTGIREVIRRADAFMLDFFQMALDPLEAELGAKSSHTVGRSHGTQDANYYSHRIDAINFALAHDDGLMLQEFGKADVILIGVSRSGKTPTSIYLSLQFGVRTANYPLTPDDFERMTLPAKLNEHRSRLFGLSIQPERLREIRNERRPGSAYSSLENCFLEVQQAETLMKREGVRWVNSTTKSIEEIATTIMQEFKLERRV